MATDIVDIRGAAPAPSAWPRIFVQGRWQTAFWKTATLLSLTINLMLVIVLIAFGQQLFAIKNGLVLPLVSGLHDSFRQLDEAHIRTTIPVRQTIQVQDRIQVNDSIPVEFDLPISTNTVVTLTEDVPLRGTTVVLNGVAIPTDIVLPAGTPLPIQLNLTVPVRQRVPVVLSVPVDLKVPVELSVLVDIPLKDTELHAPFARLRGLIAPYRELVEQAPASWSDAWCRAAPLCSPGNE